MNRHVSWFAALLVGWFALPAAAELYPVPLEQRVAQAPRIAIGTVSGQHAYWVDGHGAVTASRVRVAAWLKGRGNDDEVLVLALGGVVGDRATVVVPSLQLQVGQQYLLFLDADETRFDDRNLRRSSPGLRQSFAWADVQGALPLQFGAYRDVFEAPQTPDALLARIEGQLGLPAVTPSGARYQHPETSTQGPYSPYPIRVISSFTPNPTRGGTIDVADFLTIGGTNFGAAPGTVFYSNADDGGATFTASGVASDNVSWSDSSIVNKPPGNAGTGPININGAQTSASNLTVNWTHGAINSDFSGFAGVVTRQRYYLRNMNATGGLSLQYNTTFATNLPAVAAVERALSTWRCATGVNFAPAVATTSATTAVLDGINVVLFDGTLPAGVLGRATSRFSGGANGACNLQNTVWGLTEVDLQFRPDPPVPGFTWEFGPALPAASEYDFESVALHELGHAIGLGHIVAPAQLMHFQILNGANARTPAALEIQAGQVKMAYSDDPTCFNPGGLGSGPMVPVAPGVCNLVGETADVAITKTDGSTTAVPGTPVTYTIVASNIGPNTATGVTVADTFAASLSGCSTTSVAAGGATGNAAGPVAGNINDGGITLPMGGSVTFTATCNISAGATGTLVNTATVTAVTSDPNSANNSATDTNTLLGNLLFANGFE